MFRRASDARIGHDRLALHFRRQGRGRLVISSYPKIDISWLITSISEAWKRSSLFIARRPRIRERTRRRGSGEGGGGEEKERRKHDEAPKAIADLFSANLRFLRIRLCRRVYRDVSREKTDTLRDPIGDSISRANEQRSGARESVLKRKKKEGRTRGRERRGEKAVFDRETFAPIARSPMTFPERSEDRGSMIDL